MGDNLNKNIGKRIKELRISKKMNLHTLAIKCMVTKQYLDQVEKGNIKPDSELLIDLSKNLNVSLDYLITGSEPSANIPKNSILFSNKNTRILSENLNFEDLVNIYTNILSD